MVKRIARAFLTGGIAGVIGQLLVNLTCKFIPDPMLGFMAGILLFGVVAAIFILSGLYFKIAAYGTGGAAIVLSGLMFGCATGAAAAEKNGQSKGKAFLTGFWGVFKVVGAGYLICFILGLLLK